MILDIPANVPNPTLGPDGRCLYEVLDARTGEVIAESIFYADDERGFYRRYGRLEPASLTGLVRDQVLAGPSVEEVRRPIRIVPRLERLCATLRASLASLGVAADDIPYGRPWTRADLERFLPEVRVEADATPARVQERCIPRIGDGDVCQRCGGWIAPDIDYPCPAAI